MEVGRYMSRKQLKKVAAEGDAMGFNRQIAPWVLKKLANGIKIGVKSMLIHEHIAGALTEPHMRTLVGFKLRNGTVGSAFIDMKIETLNSLPAMPTDNHSIRSQTILPSLDATFA